MRREPHDAARACSATLRSLAHRGSAARSRGATGRCGWASATVFRRRPAPRHDITPAGQRALEVPRACRSWTDRRNRGKQPPCSEHAVLEERSATAVGLPALPPSGSSGLYQPHRPRRGGTSTCACGCTFFALGRTTPGAGPAPMARVQCRADLGVTVAGGGNHRPHETQLGNQEPRSCQLFKLSHHHPHLAGAPTSRRYQARSPRPHGAAEKEESAATALLCRATGRTTHPLHDAPDEDRPGPAHYAPLFEAQKQPRRPGERHRSPDELRARRSAGISSARRHPDGWRSNPFREQSTPATRHFEDPQEAALDEPPQQRQTGVEFSVRSAERERPTSCSWVGQRPRRWRSHRVPSQDRRNCGT